MCHKKAKRDEKREERLFLLQEDLREILCRERNPAATTPQINGPASAALVQGLLAGKLPRKRWSEETVVRD